jgi:hypothetical protein
MRLLIAFYLLYAGIASAAEDWQTALQKAARKVVEAIDKSGNYICMQDVARYYYEVHNTAVACRQPPAIPSTPLRAQDRLKLDVAVSQGAEIYSWHGENKFSAGSVGELVRDGPIASGSFNGYLRNIFGEHGVRFTYRGRSKAGNLYLYHFDYQVQLEASHYQVQAGKSYVLAPFHGSFAVNGESFELHSLTVTADGDKLPPKADICASETRLTYQVVKISNHDSLLPGSFDLLMGARDGSFTESKGIYSACRAYTGESTVHFDMEDTPESTGEPAKLQTEPLRSGVHLRIGLRGEIDEDSAYAGMPVEATLLRDAKVSKGVTLARGAMLRGTITRFEIYHQPAHSVVIKLEFSDITDGKSLYLCNAVREVSPIFAPGFSGGGRRGSMPSRGMYPLSEPTDGSIVFNGLHIHLDTSFKSSFITADIH